MQSKIKFITGQQVVKIIADDNTNTFVCNGKKYEVETVLFNSRLKTITKNWPEAAGAVGLIGVNCEVVIKEGKNKVIKTIGNSLPNTYGMFLQLIGGFND